MLSNPPPSGLQARQRQHRRQNSTPTAFDTMKIAGNLPNHMQQQQQHHHQQQQQGRPRVSHRRGMSLDTRRQQMHSPTLRQDFHHMVSEQRTNTGLNNTPQQVLREAQQQSMARPGPHQHQQAFANLASGENYLMSPHGTPQMQVFDGQCFDTLQAPQGLNMSYNMFNEQVAFKKNNENFSGNMTTSQDFELYPSSTMSTPTFVSFNESPNGAPGWTSEGETSSTRRASRRISNGIMDRVSKFETLGLEDAQRPATPPHQNANDYFPPTPMETPYDQIIKQNGRLHRFAEGYDESMEETMKPTRHGGNQRAKTTFDEMRQAAEGQHDLPASRRHSTMSVPGTYETSHMTNPDFLDMNQLNSGMTIQTQFDGLPGPSHPLSASSDFSHQNMPMTPHMVDFNGPFSMKPDLRPPEMGLQMHPVEEGSQSTEKPSRRNSPHRRTESVASMASAASIASIDIEQTKTPTGITLDDINQFIKEPDQRVNKWVCTFENCNKRFGRKENIKSHVQTHLNDRQYKCPNCSKCFVRQHDLKRHAKIHTGVKPYPCQCGNTFARHDALTRHRQRGMCIGAIDGVVRKVVKRGRPRKLRPDMDERKDKSARTRKKNKSVSSTSSQSGYSDSSEADSPENLAELDMLDDIMDISMGGTTMNPLSLQDMGSSSAPMPTIGTDLVLSAHSPSAASVHSYVSQLSHMSLHPDAVADRTASHPASPAKSASSPNNNSNHTGCSDLPELSQPSSSPSCSRFLEVEPNSAHGEIMISSAVENANIPSFAGLEDAEDVLLFQQFTSDDSMLMLSSESKLDEDYGNNEPMLMLSRDGELDEGYGSNTAIFTNHEDMFFGSA